MICEKRWLRDTPNLNYWVIRNWVRKTVKEDLRLYRSRLEVIFFEFESTYWSGSELGTQDMERKFRTYEEAATQAKKKVGQY